MSRYAYDGTGFRRSMPSDVSVLRLGHRKGRDPRITTHLALVARALGSTRFFLAGDEDEGVFANVASVNERFGGQMVCEHVGKGVGRIKRFALEDAGDGAPGVVVHLTMYGEPYRQVVPRIRRDWPLMVVVGGAKVPGDVFKHAHYNVAVGNQPHSEVAALALFLEAWSGEGGTEQHFPDAQLVIHPSATGKSVTDRRRLEEE